MEETLPLLQRSSNGNLKIRDNEESSLSSSLSSSSSNSCLVPMYGSTLPIEPKTVQSYRRVTYTWLNLNAYTRNTGHRWFRKGQPSKHILKDVTGIAYPGELLALMGASGAGKTTLMNALTFRNPSDLTISGIRSINGSPVTSKLLANYSAYVQQDDLFIGNLTVIEHLTFHASVRMDRKLSSKQRLERVQQVLDELSLDKCRNVRIGQPGVDKGISGGEMKRLAFASEILNDPSLMFCDEPTSGLDSYMAYNVVSVLRNMAANGKTVICTIHQPSSDIYAMFQKIVLLAEGRVAFFGTPEEAYSFFQQIEAPCPKNYNPADYYIQILAIHPEQVRSSREAVNTICDQFQASTIGRKVTEEAHRTVQDFDISDVPIIETIQNRSPYKVSWCRQFRAVLWRSWLTVIKEPKLIRVKFIQTLLISLLITTIYYHQSLNAEGVININGVLFLFITNMTFQNLFSVIHIISSELPLFLREHRSGLYRCDVYFLSKTLADLPISFAIPILFVSVAYYLIGLNPAIDRFLYHTIIMILICNIALSFGYLISCIAHKVEIGLALAPPLVVPFLLFGGFFLNIDSIPFYFQWLSYLSWFKYANEGLMINQWDGIDNIDCPSINITCPRNGDIVLATFNFRKENFIYDIYALLILAIGIRVVAFLILLLKTYVAKS